MSNECCNAWCRSDEDDPAPITDEWGHTYCSEGCQDDASHAAEERRWRAGIADGIRAYPPLG